MMDLLHTWANSTPSNLVGKSVAARPFYHEQTSRSSFSSARSKWTVDGLVISASEAMVVVEFREKCGPWTDKQQFTPAELHMTICRCDACSPGGAGFSHHSGA